MALVPRGVAPFMELPLRGACHFVVSRGQGHSWPLSSEGSHHSWSFPSGELVIGHKVKPPGVESWGSRLNTSPVSSTTVTFLALLGGRPRRFDSAKSHITIFNLSFCVINNN